MLSEAAFRATGRSYQEMKASEEVELLQNRDAAGQVAGEKHDRCIVAVAQLAQLEDVENVPEYLKIEGMLPRRMLYIHCITYVL